MCSKEESVGTAGAASAAASLAATGSDSRWSTVGPLTEEGVNRGSARFAMTVCFLTMPATRSPDSDAAAQSASIGPGGSVLILPCTPAPMTATCDFLAVSLTQSRPRIDCRESLPPWFAYCRASRSSGISSSATRPWDCMSA